MTNRLFVTRDACVTSVIDNFKLQSASRRETNPTSSLNLRHILLTSKRVVLNLNAPPEGCDILNERYIQYHNEFYVCGRVRVGRRGRSEHRYESGAGVMTSLFSSRLVDCGRAAAISSKTNGIASSPRKLCNKPVVIVRIEALILEHKLQTGLEIR